MEIKKGLTTKGWHKSSLIFIILKIFAKRLYQKLVPLQTENNFKWKE